LAEAKARENEALAQSDMSALRSSKRSKLTHFPVYVYERDDENPTSSSSHRNLEDTLVRRIIVASEDTDTTVIAVRHASEIAAKLSISVQDAASVDSNVKFCVQCGIAELELLDIFSIANSLGADLCLALPGMHALTGCDTVSFFKTKGKTLAWKIFLENHPRFTDAFKALGEKWNL
jgi:hypothetical protein